jgi:hypothetical protein
MIRVEKTVKTISDLRDFFRRIPKIGAQGQRNKSRATATARSPGPRLK